MKMSIEKLLFNNNPNIKVIYYISNIIIFKFNQNQLSL